MASVPQLQKDINDLQEKLKSAQARIAELESAPPRVVKEYVQMPGDVRVEYRDRIVTVPGPERVIEVIKEVPGPERIVEVIKEVPGPERVIKELVPGPERVVIKEVPGPERVVYKRKVVTVPGPERIVEVIKEVPGPERVIEIVKETPERVVEVVRNVPGPERVIVKEKKIKVPFETVKIEYRDRVVTVPGPERVVEVIKEVPGPERIVYVDVPGPERVVKDPEQEKIIKKLQEKLRRINGDSL